MKQRILPLFLILVASVSPCLADTEVRGDVDGEWTAEDSPYIVMDDIRIPEERSLVIQPGVSVEFNGYFRLTVSGRISAVGTEDDTIRFIPHEGDRQWHGIRLTDTNEDNRIEYCYFRRSAQLDNFPSDQSHGGAIYAVRSRISVQNSEFDSNHANGQGGAACFTESEGDFSFNNIHNNYGYSLIVWELNANVSIRNNLFENNEGAYGAGLLLDASSAPIENNVFRYNRSNTMRWGCALYLVHDYNSEVRNNLIHDNRGGGGVYIGYGARPSAFEHNTIANNQGDNGVFVINGSHLNAVNCIFWGNTEVDLAFSGGTASLAYSAIGEVQDVDMGDGMVREDPLFTDPENGDYSLQINSPCRDSGDPDSQPDPDGTRADMGCFLDPPANFVWIPDEPVNFGVVGLGERARRTVLLAYINGNNPDILVLLQPNPQDWWLRVRPGEEQLEQGDSLDIQLDLLIPEDAAPGEYEASVELRLDENRGPFSTLDVSFFVVEGVATYYGTISDAQTGAPIPGAEISLNGFERGVISDVSDRNGQFSISRIPAAELRPEVFHPDYHRWIGDPIRFEQGDSVLYDVNLAYASCVPDHDSISADIAVGERLVREVEITNPGSGRLDFTTEVLPFCGGLDSLEIRANIPTFQQTRENMLQAVEFINGEYWAAGSNNGMGRGIVYHFDREGALIDTFFQAALSQYGLRDLAWDGEVLWGCDESTIYGYSLDGDVVHRFNELPRICRGIAYDPESELLWVSAGANTLYGVDRAGNVVFQRRDFTYPATGLSWFSEDDDGMNLYVVSDTEDGSPTLSKFNVNTGQHALFGVLPGEETASGGSAITNQVDPGNWTLVNIIRNGDDPEIGEGFIRAFYLETFLGWLDVTPAVGSIEAGQSSRLALNIEGVALPVGMTLPAEIHINHNGRGEVTVIPLELTVHPNAVDPYNPHAGIPSKYSLHAASPNPFNSSTTLRFDLPEASVVSLSVFDLQGRLVEILAGGKHEAGIYRASWNADDAPAGVYLCKMEAGQFSATRKLLLVK